MAPPGKSTFYALAPVPHLGKLPLDWDREGPALRATHPRDPRGAADARPVASGSTILFHFGPADFESELNAHLGSAFSLEPLLTQSAWFRVHNRDDMIPNLYFVGAGTHPGAGIPGRGRQRQGDRGPDDRGPPEHEPRPARRRGAGESIRHGSKSFRLASRLFDRRTRERAWLLYCWCRALRRRLRRPGARLQDAIGRRATVAAVELLTGQVARRRESRAPALRRARVVCRPSVRSRAAIVDDHLEGFALDAEGWRPDDEEDLLRYCYHVAGAVGCMMAVVMGVKPDEETTLARACDLGIAFQLSNIARDLRDDHESGRCYLPEEWIELYGLDRHDPFRPDRREALVAVAGRLTDLALRYEVSAHVGVAELPFRARWAVLAAARVYGTIGRRVAALGPVAWESRIIVRRREKLAFLLPTLVEAIRTR